MPTKSIKLENSKIRAVLFVAVLFCLIGVYFSAKWSFAQTIALQSVNQEYAPPTEIGEIAVKLAPSDPQTHYALGVLYDKSFLPENQPKSLAEYEKATALAPNDFRLWLNLGKARERSGDASGAENALRRAMLLAPNYSLVQWTFGNFLLRQNRMEEAFAEIRKAAENDSVYANPAIFAAWQRFDGDISQIRQNLGESLQIKKSLRRIFTQRKEISGGSADFVRN